MCEIPTCPSLRLTVVGAITREENPLRHYQTVIILKPDLDEGHVDEAVIKLTGFLEKCGGKDTRLEKWGKKRLAYRIRKNKFGYYLNWFHTCDPAGVAAFEKELQLFDLVIKYMVIRLEEKDFERVLKQADQGETAENGDKESSEKEEPKKEEAKKEEPKEEPKDEAAAPA